MSLLQFSGAYSFGTSQRKVFEVKNADEPSPIQYQNVDIKTNKNDGISFTKQQKIPNIQNKAPPLGQYKIQYKQVQKDVPGKSFLKKPKQPIVHEKLGPGSYNIVDNKLQTVTHTFGYKIQQNQSEIQNKYDDNSKISNQEKKMLKPNFSKSDRNITTIKNNMIPGPGEYSVDISCLTPKSLVSFGKGSRPQIIDKFRVKNPGPGSYDDNQSQNAQNKTSDICYFGGRTQDYELKYRSQFPSPCKYDPIKPQNNQQTTFKKAKRDDIIQNNKFPGPGDYNPEKVSQSSKFSIGNTERSINILSSKDNPGPGNYQIKSQAIEGYAPTLRSKRKENINVNNNPGPGMYNVIQQNNGRYSLIGTSDHLNNHDVLYKTTLGPGQYQVKSEMDGPKYTMGKLINPKKKDFNKEFDYVAESTVGFIPKYLTHEVRKEQY